MKAFPGSIFSLAAKLQVPLPQRPGKSLDGSSDRTGGSVSILDLEKKSPRSSSARRGRKDRGHPTPGKVLENLAPQANTEPGLLTLKPLG